MTRSTPSLVTVVTACIVALHSILLPALYYGVGLVIRNSHEELFVQNSRTFARVLADEFEVGAGLGSESRISDLLDLAIIHGEARYAELLTGDHAIHSQLGSRAITAPRHTDLGFQRGADHIYFIVLPIEHAGSTLELRLGFDEVPTEERIQLALNRMLILLATYACVTIGIAVFLGRRLSRPIHRLQHASRAIASGDYAQTLKVGSRVRELRDLAQDLDAMRGELVGVNIRLQEQIRDKEAAEVRRDALEKQLRHRQRLETVGTLAGGIAHEFNNVLVPIMLFTDTALQDLPPDSLSRADLERVMASARRAKNIVQKILTFSHVLGDSQLTSIDMRAVVRDGLNLFTALAPPSIQIHSDIGDEIPAVNGDAALALDLLMNLCTNALQAMQGTNGTLTVGLRHLATSDTESTVELWVSDTGHGIDPATLERIFEPFFTTRPVGEGTGLGLAVVHGIVKSFNAKIAVETLVGKGTTIRIIFPPATAETVGGRQVVAQ